MSSAAQRFFLPCVARITEKSEFQRVFSQGEKLWGRLFVCYVLIEAATERRLGLVVSRKVGGAVVRNRVKRHIREFFRLNRHRLTPGLQLVVVARMASAVLDGNACSRELERLLGKHLSHGE
jgi:ribonuclease P protein component